MIIVFEGHDRSGKTTIANKLARLYDTEVFMSNSKECFTDKGIFANDSSNIARFNYYIAKYACDLQNKESINKPMVIYRSFLSEMVYSRLLDRKTDNFMNESTDQILNRHNAVIVLCKNSKAKNFEDRFLNNKTIKKSIEIYDELKYDINCDLLEIETSGHQVDEYVDYIAQYIRTKRGI